jgi:hypothetical protein
MAICPGRYVPVLETASTADTLSVNLVAAGRSASWSPVRAPAIGPRAWLTSDPDRVAGRLGTLTSPGRNGLMAESKTVDKDSRRTFSAALQYATSAQEARSGLRQSLAKVQSRSTLYIAPWRKCSIAPASSDAAVYLTIVDPDRSMKPVLDGNRLNSRFGL